MEYHAFSLLSRHPSHSHDKTGGVERARQILHLRDTWLCHRSHVHSNLGIRGQLQLEVARGYQRVVIPHLRRVSAGGGAAVPVDGAKRSAARAARSGVHAMDVLLGVQHGVDPASIRRMPMGLHALPWGLHGTSHA